MPNHDDVDDLQSPNDPPSKETCPMCGEPVASNAQLLTCSECGGEGYDDCCIPGGRGTACVDCEADDA